MSVALSPCCAASTARHHPVYQSFSYCLRTEVSRVYVATTSCTSWPAPPPDRASSERVPASLHMARIGDSTDSRSWRAQATWPAACGKLRGSGGAFARFV